MKSDSNIKKTFHTIVDDWHENHWPTSIDDWYEYWMKRRGQVFSGIGGLKWWLNESGMDLRINHADLLLFVLGSDAITRTSVNGIKNLVGQLWEMSLSGFGISYVVLEFMYIRTDYSVCFQLSVYLSNEADQIKEEIDNEALEQLEQILNGVYRQ